jgi:hypothetical protein
MYGVLVYTSGSDTTGAASTMDANTTVKVIAGVLCLVLVAIIILRKKGKKKADEEF